MEQKFNLPDYTLASPQEWFNNKSQGIAGLSAIGLTRDRSRAGVCLAVENSDGSSGTCLFLAKAGGKWRQDTDDHEGCGFGGRIYR